MITPDDALNLLLDYPTIIHLVLDGYEPRLASVLIEMFRELDDETARMSVKLWAQAAEKECNNN
ncbi:MAG TPA: hypothetical protein VL866_24270 [Pyrinomonadaceae bacterium]|nr:hypothetical protein [Pyrinomonadaceae bacterium]